MATTCATDKQTGVTIEYAPRSTADLIGILKFAMNIANQNDGIYKTFVPDAADMKPALLRWLSDVLGGSPDETNSLFMQVILTVIIPLAYVISLMFAKLLSLQNRVVELEHQLGRKSSQLGNVPPSADKFNKRRGRSSSKKKFDPEAADEKPSETPGETESLDADENPSDEEDLSGDLSGEEGSDEDPSGDENSDSSDTSKPNPSDDPRYEDMAQNRDRSIEGLFGAMGNDKAYNHTGMPLPSRDVAEYSEPIYYMPSKCNSCPRRNECCKNSSSCGTSYTMGYKVTLIVNSHIACKVECPLSGETLRGELPADLKGSKSYSSDVKSDTLCIHYLGYASGRSSASIINAITGIGVGKSSVINWKRELARNLESEGTIKGIRNSLLASSVAHTDETGRSVNGSLHWIHVIANAKYALYHIHKKRGFTGIADEPAMMLFSGVLVHDFWKPYFNLPDWVIHSLCNVHICRDLLSVAVYFNEDYKWSSDLLHVFLSANLLRKEWKAAGKTEFTPEIIHEIERSYRSAIAQGLILHTEEHSFTKALLKRLQEHEEEHLRFIHSFEVPFGNNCAEQAMRKPVLHEKVSMAYRNEELSKDDMIILSYVGTSLRQNKNVKEALKAAFEHRSAEFLFPDGIPEMPATAKAHMAFLEQEKKEREQLEKDLASTREELESTKERISRLSSEEQLRKEAARAKEAEAGQLKAAARAEELSKEDRAQLRGQVRQMEQDAKCDRQAARETRTMRQNLEDAYRGIKALYSNLKEKLGIRDQRGPYKAKEKKTTLTAEQLEKEARKARKQSIYDQMHTPIDFIERAKGNSPAEAPA